MTNNGQPPGGNTTTAGAVEDPHGIAENKAGGLWYRRWHAAQTRVNELEALLANPPKHKFWGAGEPDCPREIKAPNGELHTLRCRVCGIDNPRDDACSPPDNDGTVSTCETLARRMGGRFVPAAHNPASFAETQEFFRDGGKTSQAAALRNNDHLEGPKP